MSNPEITKQLRNIGNSYMEMLKKEDAAVAEKAAEAVTSVKPTPPAPEEISEDVIPQKAGANAFSAGSKLAKTRIKSSTAIAKGVEKSKSLMNGDDAEEDEDPKKKSKKRVTINPDLSEDGHTDVSSAIRKCKTIMEDAQDILTALEGMNPEDGLPSWWTNAITISAHEMNSMRDYIKNPGEKKD